jgi:hypothetical protein
MMRRSPFWVTGSADCFGLISWFVDIQSTRNDNPRVFLLDHLEVIASELFIQRIPFMTEAICSYDKFVKT